MNNDLEIKFKFWAVSDSNNKIWYDYISAAITTTMEDNQLRRDAIHMHFFNIYNLSCHT